MPIGEDLPGGSNRCCSFRSETSSARGGFPSVLQVTAILLQVMTVAVGCNSECDGYLGCFATLLLPFVGSNTTSYLLLIYLYLLMKFVGGHVMEFVILSFVVSTKTTDRPCKGSRLNFCSCGTNRTLRTHEG